MADCARAYTPPYDCTPCIARDLRLRRGDLLQVMGETELWYYVRKRTLKNKGTLTEERGYVPKHFVRRVCNLKAEPWFFESITKRIEAKRCLLRQENGEGAFMVWRSKENPQYYLSVRNGEAARHYKIVEVGQLFYLVPRRAFHTLCELVDAYSQDQGGLCVRLNEPCVTVKRQWYEQWEVQRSSLRRVERLGSGEFGEVWSGVWNSNMEVAIKEFRAMDSDVLNEIRILTKLSHCRVLKLYGVCTMDMPFCIITELMRNGSLHRFLRGKSSKPIKS
ncbi:hypothetical protein AAFF_G00431350 [Aldrovandia affinis]|uniref:Tyrosine-protein kinase n=1 Tax=Aldrovandia affinis TaxID=143900 RepID=A0AAD7S929_9TELE|nr:hypothetical protein AAFF_G00431350 [Aldrovandia affinis]